MMALSGVRISWLTLARKSDLCDEATFRLALRRDQLLLGLLELRDVAQHGAEAITVAEAPHRHEQRHAPALTHAAEDLAAVIEDAGDTVAPQAVEIVDRRAVAFGCDEDDEGFARDLGSPPRRTAPRRCG